MKLLALLLVVLACDRVTRTDYPAGWASVAAIVPATVEDSLRIVSRQGHGAVTAYPGDSVCLRFWSDGWATQFFDIYRFGRSVLLPWLPARGAMHLSVISFGIAHDQLTLVYGGTPC